MKSRTNMSAMAGTALLLGLAIVVHSAGRFGGQADTVGAEPPPSSGIDLGFFGRAANDPVEAFVLKPEDAQRFPNEGKEADAIAGDIRMSNGFLSAVVAQPLATRHANMTVKDVAGALIDLSSRRRLSDSDPDKGGDQLAAFYPGRKAFPYRSVTTQSFDPKANGGTTSITTVKAEGAEGRPEVTVAYELNQKQPFLTVKSTFANRTTKPLIVPLEDHFRADGEKEEMVRSPDGTADRFWLYDSFWGQAYGLDADGYKLQLTSDRRVTTIKYENAVGETSITLVSGDSFELKRRIYPGATIFDVHAIADKMFPPAFALFTIPGVLTEAGTSSNLTLELSRGKTVVGRARMAKTPTLFTSLPPGNYSAQLRFCGSDIGNPQSVQIAPGHNDIALKLDQSWGRIRATPSDEGGWSPCKIELKPLDENAKLDFGPETGEFAVRNLIYAPNGWFDRLIPVGKYAVTISHGPEFDIVQKEIEVTVGGTVTLDTSLVRSVDTTGWVSSDFHSHSSPSGDNTSSQLGRVVNLVCEHIEFAPCTEHNRVSTYAPHIDRLRIGQFIASVPGIELTSTPLPLNHQNAFPMIYRPFTQDGGGPVSGPDLESQIERLGLWDHRSEKLLQVNHPDIGWMFYDKDGDGKPDAGFERAFPFMDVVEIHPIEDALHLGPTAPRGTSVFHNTVFNWLQLLNQGFRIYGVVNTDAHYNFHGSGFLRNWIQSSTDSPGKIDPMEMVHAAEQGRLVMSNGPFLEVTAHETGKADKVVAGQDLKAGSGRVTLKIRVQCPNWLDVNRLFVLVNSRPHPVHDYSREKHPDAFRSGVVKFERSLDLELKGDAHIVVVTGHVGGSLGSVPGPTYGKAQPAAITNPIFVDVDGNGFQPNKDTLDAPLPVKHPNSKP